VLAGARGELTFQVIYSFTNSGPDPRFPSTGLIQASNGNFYGATGPGASVGTLFRFSPTGTLTMLWSFTNVLNGDYRRAKLIQGIDGNLLGFGTVFRITTNGVFSNVFNFNGTNGSKPTGELIEFADGNFYGTTTFGGNNNLGTIFRITSGGVLTTITSLNLLTGTAPQGGLCKASDGNLYRTTLDAGPNGGGTIFRLVVRRTITSITAANGAITLTWNSFASAAYRVEYRTNIDSGPWLTASPRVLSSGTTASFTDSATTNTTRYYHVALLPQ
jgi:uncharacterized repeat protein (TIGR03803 family)